MNIFEALRESHDEQRTLCDKLEKASTSDDRKTVYEKLKLELTAHASAEDRTFYMPLMERDKGLDLSRHAIAEHHEMDELMHKLDDLSADSKQWIDVSKDLTHKVRHHLDEEEHKFFQMAGKILTDSEKLSLANKYTLEESAFKNKHG